MYDLPMTNINNNNIVASSSTVLSIPSTNSVQLQQSLQQSESGCIKEGLIRCIFLSKFHPTEGSKISCQVPENFISKEIFDAVNVYIIPKPQLQRCVMTVNTLGVKILGYPVKIDSQKYARNAFYFNLCFVCDAVSRTNQYEPVVKKLSEYLIIMEEESEFLSKIDDKIRLQRLLEKILNDLNVNMVTTILESEYTINLKIVIPPPDPTLILDQMVPLLKTEYKSIPVDSWDLTTQQILPYIDGNNHISRIAASADVDLNLVKNCIQNLAYYSVVQLLPILKYSNVYMCTQNLKNLCKNTALYAACKKYVSLKPDRYRPSLQKVFQFYASMTHGITLRSICQRLSPQHNNIDERKLVIFGLQHSFIRCIHKYPVFTGTVPNDRQKFYTGIYNFDEICCKLGLSLSNIENDIDLDTNISVIWK
ncbi:GATOR complex protein NPRL2 [Condylostylus longicornis]|uniref:GATOR complex protein NPRL2 n=1 Tax=Condylostylus longicornis TaxID=2530218 RepID=UPI00244E33BA|nr:GATOR complex protein NPRL2 [Condylostylus longicornis]